MRVDRRWPDHPADLVALVTGRRAERCEDLTYPRFGFDQGLLEIGEFVRLGGQGIRIMAGGARERLAHAGRRPARLEILLHRQA